MLLSALLALITCCSGFVSAMKDTVPFISASLRWAIALTYLCGTDPMKYFV